MQKDTTPFILPAYAGRIVVAMVASGLVSLALENYVTLEKLGRLVVSVGVSIIAVLLFDRIMADRKRMHR